MSDVPDLHDRHEEAVGLPGRPGAAHSGAQIVSELERQHFLQRLLQGIVIFNNIYMNCSKYILYVLFQYPAINCEIPFCRPQMR